MEIEHLLRFIRQHLTKERNQSRSSTNKIANQESKRQISINLFRFGQYNSGDAQGYETFKASRTVDPQNLFQTYASGFSGGSKCMSNI